MSGKEKKASDDYDRLKGYKTKFYKGELNLSETDSILFSVSEGDPVKAEQMRLKVKRMTVLNFEYKLRLSRLNELLSSLDSLNNIENKKRSSQ